MDIYKVLNQLEIDFEEHCHQPVFTIEQAKMIEGQLNGTGCKNILLADKHGENFVLLLLHEDKKADLKAVSSLTGLKKPRFAKEDELMALLGLIPGSVSPFGLINDCDHKVSVVIDRALEGQRLLFHPNDNSKTVALSFSDLTVFLDYTQNKYILL